MHEWKNRIQVSGFGFGVLATVTASSASGWVFTTVVVLGGRRAEPTPPPPPHIVPQPCPHPRKPRPQGNPPQPPVPSRPPNHVSISCSAWKGVLAAGLCGAQAVWVPSLVAQMVKNPPAMLETWVQSLGQKEPWRRAWQPLQYFGLEGYSPWGCKESHTAEWLSLAFSFPRGEKSPVAVGHPGRAERAGSGSVQCLWAKVEGRAEQTSRRLCCRHCMRPGCFPPCLVGHRLGLTCSLLKGSVQSLG